MRRLSKGLSVLSGSPSRINEFKRPLLACTSDPRSPLPSARFSYSISSPGEALSMKKTAKKKSSPATPRSIPKIDRVSIHHGKLDPKLSRVDRGWYLTIVEIEAGGQSGWGEAGITYYPIASAAPWAAERMTHDVLIGANPMDNVRLWEAMLDRANGPYQGGAVGFGALAALDVALWDLKGKLLGLPIYQLLGGACHSHLRAYANGWCYGAVSEDDYRRAVERPLKAGFTAMKFDPWRYHEGEFKEHPAPGKNSSRAWMRVAEKSMAAVRHTVGRQTDLILEAHGKFSPARAIDIGRRAAAYDFLYYEEPTRHVDPQVMRRVADQQPIPLAGGEHLVRMQEFRSFCDAQGFQLAQPDVGVCGGITPIARMAQYAAEFRIGFQPHNSALGLNTAAAFQVSAAQPNFVIQETFPFRDDDWMGLLHDPYERRIVDGYLPLSDAPGLGVEVNRPWLERLDRIQIEANS